MKMLEIGKASHRERDVNIVQTHLHLYRKDGTFWRRLRELGTGEIPLRKGGAQCGVF